ncbi:hypothetical protein BDU57DRAFT_276712 [Ampelomyces quisqualis]|uniref:Proteophosphoglycan 5 n=1 Tax=Ampelomyces quisqualis TaxID=50730 RepID=A0A6A5QLL2_AMPQU|nr:hypothetical protein BDU57DRAFT_276712 [Ampelomyces quisqualis]
MSTVPGTASPRAPRAKPQPPQSAAAQVPQNNNNARQGQRRPRGARARNSSNQNNQSPNRPSPHADTALPDGAAVSGRDGHRSNAPRNPKKHTPSQPSVDRVFSPPGALASLTDTESAPSNPIAATPAKNQGAYAGPTFHASPAPSALPIPKFLSRSVPAKTRIDPPTPPPEDSSDFTGSPQSMAASPSRAPIPVPSRNEQSPLDMLFKADRAERSKCVNGSPASTQFFTSAHAGRPHHYEQDSYGSLNAPFPIELDGESRTTHMSSPALASPMNARSVTDPTKIPQLKDVCQSPKNNDVMQDLLNRLSMSQNKPTAPIAPQPDARRPAPSETRNETPSPSHDGRSAVRSASGPSAPAAAPNDNPDFFYGNRNLSPLFKAAKNEPSKRNSGLRTEITADSPLIAQGMFQDFPSVSSPRAMDPNTFNRNYPVGSPEVPAGPRSGSAPYIQPHRGTPNGRRQTPERQPQHTRNGSYSTRSPPGPGVRPNAGVNGAPASVKKPATSMMSFVPASVAAKKHSSSAPPSAAGPSPVDSSTSSNTLALEQDLKRMLNLSMANNGSGVR